VIRSGATVVLLAGVLGGPAAWPQAAAPSATGVNVPGIRHAMSELHPRATFNVGGDPDWMAVTPDAVWVTTSSKNIVFRLDATTNRVSGSVAVAKPCSGLAVGFGSLWVPSCGDHDLVRVDLRTRRVIARIDAGPADSEGGIATGAGSVWMVTSGDGVLARIDPATNLVVARIAIPSQSYAAAYERGSVWITSAGHDLLARVDTKTNKLVSTTKVGKAPRFLTVGAGSVWTLNQGDGTISRMDARSGKLMATIDAGLAGHGGEIAYGEGAVWATLNGLPITKIDPATNRVVGQWAGKGGDSIRAGLGSVWLTNYDAGLVWRLDPSLR
jgi:virginiamycin B lyase